MTTDNPQNPGTPAQNPTVQNTIKPETVMFVRQRDKYGLVMALVALAGVGVGFGLASFSRASAPSSCDSRVSLAPAAGNLGAHVVIQDEGRTLHIERADDGHVRERHHRKHRLRLGVIVDDHAQGAEIRQLVPGMPAEAEGLLVGDVIKSFDGHEIHDAMHLVRTIKHTPRGKTVIVIIERDDQEMTFEIALAR